MVESDKAGSIDVRELSGDRRVSGMRLSKALDLKSSARVGGTFLAHLSPTAVIQ
jgi:hypothetical protein